VDPPAAPTILLIEDEVPIAHAVAHTLGHAGYHLWHAENAADARAMVRHQRPDLIVLDLSLPDVDGLVLCTWLRAEAPSVPILACSQASARERVLCLQLGAEDVLSKPFDLHELEARVRAIVRRTRPDLEPHHLPVPADSPDTPRQPVAPAVQPAVPTLGPHGSAVGPGSHRPATAPDVSGLHVDVAHWRVTLNGRRLDLTPTEFQLLAFLARRAGQVVSREEVARAVWGDASMSRSRTVDAYARRLRAKLDAPGGPRLMNVRGFGFVLVGPLPTAA
jgi:two-component system response regulator MprA